MKLLRSLAVVALLLGLAGTASATKLEAPSADPAVPSDVARVIDQVASLRSGIESYTFNVHLHIALRSFPWVGFRLKGAGEYRKDGPYVLDIENMPSFARGYGHVSLSYLDPQTWSQNYTMSVAERKGDTVVLLLHDRKKSPLVDARATIDTRFGVRKIVWRYNYGGVITLEFKPSSATHYAVPGTLDADIRMPEYHATAHADFTHYRVVADGAPNAAQATASAEPETASDPPAGARAATGSAAPAASAPASMP